jgi:glycosyltransferase 2 family protein
MRGLLHDVDCSRKIAFPKALSSELARSKCLIAGTLSGFVDTARLGGCRSVISSSERNDMSVARLVLPLTGIAILGLLLWQADFAVLMNNLKQVGIAGFLAVLLIHAGSFLCDVVLWLLAFLNVPNTRRMWLEFYLVRLIGEAYNNALPLASVGGEPIKAKLLKDYFSIDYSASGAAFLIGKTANLIALVVFLACGFIFLLCDERFPAGYHIIAGLGLLVFSFAIVLLWLVQQGRAAILIEQVLSRWLSTEQSSRLVSALTRADDHLRHCYQHAPQRFRTILALAFVTWLAGIFEIWVILAAVGVPIRLYEAWIIESAAQLVRTAAFFIPAGLGVVDGSFVLVAGTITGSATLGLLVAVVRRARDLAWIALGFVGALWYSGRQH